MISIKPVSQKSIWENFVLKSDQASFLQSFNWGEFNQKIGHRVFRFGFFDNQKLTGVSLLILKESKRGRFFESPAGPLIPWQKPEYFSLFIQTLKKLSRQHQAVFIRVRPNIPDNQDNHRLFKQAGFIKAPMHLHAQNTWVLDIRKSPDNLLKNMRKNTRYSIKKAQKMGVKVTQSTDPKDIHVLYNLQMEAVKRHHFVPFPQKHFLAQLESFKPDNQIQLFKAIYQGQIIAISFIIFYGQEAVYHYSGSSNQIKNVPASYLLQWQAILEAQKRGCQKYNFWGVAPPNKPDHRFAGVRIFKTGFGGYPVNYLPAYDLPIKPYYFVTFAFEHLRKRFRQL